MHEPTLFSASVSAWDALTGGLTGAATDPLPEDVFEWTVFFESASWWTLTEPHPANMAAVAIAAADAPKCRQTGFNVFSVSARDDRAKPCRKKAWLDACSDVLRSNPRYRLASMHGNPWLRLLRREAEDLVAVLAYAVST